MCRLVMANYEPDLAAPLLDPFNVVRRRTYADTGGRVTPYLLYLDLGCFGASTSVASGWVLDKECDLLRNLLDWYPDYTLTFTGHSLGAVIRNWLQKSSELVTCLSLEFILFSAATVVRQHTCSASDF
ncbi:hypothetical protein D1007_08079 [Hordeum vulgare]|nr:hypothetical protein D1007_08079 [Hordeum vulgare]